MSFDIEDQGNDQSKRAAYFAAPEIEQVFGTPEALDTIDAVTAIGIIKYMEAFSPLGKAERVALLAIQALATTNPVMARQLITELR